MRGRRTNDEQTFVKFDKALATGGVAGGVATGKTPALPLPAAPVHVPVLHLVDSIYVCNMLVDRLLLSSVRIRWTVSGIVGFMNQMGFLQD